MPTDLAFYLAAIPAVILIGLAKGGFAGLGALGLPILIVQDAIGVTAFRKTWDKNILLIMLPGAILGVGLGWLFAASVSADAVPAAVGGGSSLFGGRALSAARAG